MLSHRFHPRPLGSKQRDLFVEHSRFVNASLRIHTSSAQNAPRDRSRRRALVIEVKRWLRASLQKGTRPCSSLMGRRQIINDTSALRYCCCCALWIVHSRAGRSRGAKCLLMNLVARPAAIINVFRPRELHFDPQHSSSIRRVSRAWSSPRYMDPLVGGGWMGGWVTPAAAKRRRGRIRLSQPRVVLSHGRKSSFHAPLLVNRWVKSCFCAGKWRAGTILCALWWTNLPSFFLLSDNLTFLPFWFIF